MIKSIILNKKNPKDKTKSAYYPNIVLQTFGKCNSFYNGICQESSLTKLDEKGAVRAFEAQVIGCLKRGYSVCLTELLILFLTIVWHVQRSTQKELLRSAGVAHSQLPERWVSSALRHHTLGWVTRSLLAITSHRNQNEKGLLNLCIFTILPQTGRTCICSAERAEYQATANVLTAAGVHLPSLQQALKVANTKGWNVWANLWILSLVVSHSQKHNDKRLKTNRYKFCDDYVTKNFSGDRAKLLGNLESWCSDFLFDGYQKKYHQTDGDDILGMIDIIVLLEKGYKGYQDEINHKNINIA